MNYVVILMGKHKELRIPNEMALKFKRKILQILKMITYDLFIGYRMDETL